MHVRFFPLIIYFHLDFELFPTAVNIFNIYVISQLVTITSGTVPYRTLPYRTVPYRNLSYRTVRTAPYRTVPYPIVPYRTVRTAPYRTVPCYCSDFYIKAQHATFFHKCCVTETNCNSVVCTI